LPSVLWLGSRKGIRPVKTEWWDAGMVICLERGADLHMTQLMPLPLTVSCFGKIQIGFTFLVPAYPGSLGQRAVKRACVCVCVCLRSLYALVSHLSDRITRGRNAIFGHVARLPDNIPAHQAMLRQVELSFGRPPDPTWKRPPARPRTKWTDQLCRDNNNVSIATLWRHAIGCRHSRATLRSELTTR